MRSRGNAKQNVLILNYVEERGPIIQKKWLSREK